MISAGTRRIAHRVKLSIMDRILHWFVAALISVPQPGNDLYSCRSANLLGNVHTLDFTKIPCRNRRWYPRISAVDFHFAALIVASTSRLHKPESKWIPCQWPLSPHVEDFKSAVEKNLSQSSQWELLHRVWADFDAESASKSVVCT